MRCSPSTTAIISLFNTTTPNQFNEIFQLIRDTTQANQLVFFTEPFEVTTVNGPIFYWWNSGIEHEGCRCNSNVSCSQQTQLLDIQGNSVTVLYTVPRSFVGCSVVDALLLSAFECYFDRTCLNTITSSVKNRTALNITALDSSHLFLSSINTSVETIVDRLFVERLVNASNYSAYFQQCAPTECVYSFNQHPNWIDILTTVIGLYGGLTAVLKVLIPTLITLVRRKKQDNPSRKSSMIVVFA
ncbi:unnamed protein product [Didymodactylos carnosus]|uniref:Uncharacterized protein n=1 Tax=Didymodactylos carnosus TaxID=1234261 RepID=A0A8S2EGA6_9BILA|nr:unnamed protein product [Didymodactylos carnosus]CAF4026222.1 unnamed protein product [Didymodactylos carnosus]